MDKEKILLDDVDIMHLPSFTCKQVMFDYKESLFMVELRDYTKGFANYFIKVIVSDRNFVLPDTYFSDKWNYIHGAYTSSSPIIKEKGIILDRMADVLSDLLSIEVIQKVINSLGEE